MAEGGSGGSWWGGWLQAAKEKSASALDFVKKDLAEFTTVVHKDTTTAAGVVKEKLNHETASEATRKVKDGMSNLLGGLSKALVIEPEDKYDRGIPISSETHIFDRAKARLHAIQLDPETYCAEPSGPRDAYESWLAGFALDEQKGAISELLVSNVQVRSLYTQMVPSEVSHAAFWQRYFYKVHQLEQDEARKAALKRRAEVGAGEAELEWDDDDEWGDLDSPTHPHPPVPTVSDKKSSEEAGPPGTSRDREDSAPCQALSNDSSSLVICSSIDSLKTEQSSSPADLAGTATSSSVSGGTESSGSGEGKERPEDTYTLLNLEDTQPQTGGEDKAGQDVREQGAERTLAGDSAPGQPEGTTAAAPDGGGGGGGSGVPSASYVTTATADNTENILHGSSSGAAVDLDMCKEKGLQVLTRDKGDLVVIGSDRNTPSSDSNQSKELSSVDDDWEKDFDIEVSEEDIRLAQEAARKLADERASPDDDDDWENWD